MAKATVKSTSKAPRQSPVTAVKRPPRHFPVFDDRGRTVRLGDEDGAPPVRQARRRRSSTRKKHLHLATGFYLRVLAEARRAESARAQAGACSAFCLDHRPCLRWTTWRGRRPAQENARPEGSSQVLRGLDRRGPGDSSRS